MDFIRDIIYKKNKQKADISLLGMPFDEGVYAEGGRKGAAFGPKKIRNELKKYHKLYNLKHNVGISELHIFDAGDCSLKSKTSNKCYQVIEERAFDLAKISDIIINLGGGHDITISTIKALCMATKGNIGCINIDAHFDVKERPYMTSGSVFYFALKENSKQFKGKNFVEVGAHDNLNSLENYSFLQKIGSLVIPLAQVRQHGIDKVMNKAFNIAGNKTRAIHFSLDMDSIAEAFAPGVSAPSSDGFYPHEIIRIGYLAGTNPKVKMMDIVETNPKYDIQNRTARLAATIIVAFLTGYMQRKERARHGKT